MNSVQLFDIIFYVLAATVLASASIVVFSRNIVYAAFSLLLRLPELPDTLKLAVGAIRRERPVAP